MNIQGLWTILLLIVSNVFMTIAWYGQLKLSEMHISDNWPLIVIILLSWGVALLEYLVMVPANRIGSNISAETKRLSNLSSG